MSRPSASLAAKPQTPSQLDECGAPISTTRGRSGNSPTMRQPPSRSSVRPNQRAKRIVGRTRGALGGSGRTAGLVVGVCAIASLRRPSSPSRAACAPLDRTAPALGVQPALLRRARRLGRDPRLGRVQAGGDEGRQAIARVLAIAILGAEALRAEHEHAFVGQAPIARRAGARAAARATTATRDVEAQFHRGRDLVDVLSPGTGRTRTKRSTSSSSGRARPGAISSMAGL
jgi:hypothetical protein